MDHLHLEGRQSNALCASTASAPDWFSFARNAGKNGAINQARIGVRLKGELPGGMKQRLGCKGRLGHAG